jgi:hypothetical protein
MPRDLPHLARAILTTALLAQSAVTASLPSSSAASAGDTQIYKTVDAQGNVVYTDQPPSAKSQKSSVKYHEPSAQDLARVEQQRKATEAAESERVQQAAASNLAQAQQDRAQKEKQARCDNARNNYNSLRDANRVFQLDPQGNRVYLTDAEAEAKRTAARKAMEAACAS